MLEMLSANNNGIVNEEPSKPKLVYMGEPLILNKLSPIINCHHGT